MFDRMAYCSTASSFWPCAPNNKPSLKSNNNLKGYIIQYEEDTQKNH